MARSPNQQSTVCFFESFCFWVIQLIVQVLCAKSSLRDLCVRWSFGRCFREGARFFRVGFFPVPLVDCRIGNLRLRHPLSWVSQRRFRNKFEFQLCWNHACSSQPDISWV